MSDDKSAMNDMSDVDLNDSSVMSEQQREDLQRTMAESDQSSDQKAM